MKRLFCCLGFAAIAVAPVVGKVPESRPGAELYMVHCAACHGRNATGSGPMTSQLRHVPPDLTQLSAKNGGMFPRARVRRIVEGRDVPAHGDRDMPIWGDVFMKVDPGASAGIDERINAIISYLESIQARPAH